MDVHEAIRTRYAVRDFRPDPLPQETILRILEAGRLAPSQRNRQQWHFVVVQDRETLKRIGELAPTGPYVAQAPLAVVVVMQGAKMAQVDAARAAENMILAAWAEGVGTCWVGGIERDKVKELLGIPPDGEIVTILPFGYPKKLSLKGKKNRKPLSEVAHRERFGNPYSSL
ncbi:MAG: nitroreductase family protein [Candidatus Tectomicrobia bacterium]|nr:nitroreductase family protein [Candidatus Tectomicrobia bacterium]